MSVINDLINSSLSHPLTIYLLMELRLTGMVSEVKFVQFSNALSHTFFKDDGNSTSVSSFWLKRPKKTQKNIEKLQNQKKVCKFAGRIDVNMDHREKNNRIAYFNCCIQAFGVRFKLKGKEAYRYLRNFMGMDFLYRFYEAEHTQSIDDAIDDLILICKRNGGALG